MDHRHRWRFAALAVVALLVLATVPGTVLAAPVQGIGGTVVVEPGETVDRVDAVAGTVVVRGTVTGDVNVATGSLVVTGVVGGDVRAGAGSVDLRGRVDGDVTVGTGSLVLAEGAVVGGRLEAGVGTARLAGTVRGDAAVGGGDIVLAPTATFEGDLRYDGDLDDRGATVEGRLVRDESLSGTSFQPFAAVGEAALDVYGLLVTLVLGAVLLAVFPVASGRLAARVAEAPLETALYGLLALVGVPVLLVLVALTVIGIPLALVGAVLFALVAWVGSVYGRYALGEWLLASADVDHRWAALLVGVVVVALLGLVPVLGGVVRFVVLLLGLGALAWLGLGGYRARRQAG